LGENDNQNLRTPGNQIETPIGTAEFPDAYAARVRRFAKIATSEGGHVIWIGLPNARDMDPGRVAFVHRQNQIYEDVAAALLNVAFFDTWDAFAARDGGYTAYYRD